MLDQIVEKNDLTGADARSLNVLKERLRSGTVEDCPAAHPYLQDLMEATEYSTWSGEIWVNRLKTQKNNDCRVCTAHHHPN